MTLRAGRLKQMARPVALVTKKVKVWGADFES